MTGSTAVDTRRAEAEARYLAVLDLFHARSTHPAWCDGDDGLLPTDRPGVAQLTHNAVVLDKDGLCVQVVQTDVITTAGVLVERRPARVCVAEVGPAGDGVLTEEQADRLADALATAAALACCSCPTAARLEPDN